MRAFPVLAACAAFAAEIPVSGSYNLPWTGPSPCATPNPESWKRKCAGKPEIRIKPAAWLGWKGLGVYAEADLGKNPEFIGGARFQY